MKSIIQIRPVLITIALLLMVVLCLLPAPSAVIYFCLFAALLLSVFRLRPDRFRLSRTAAARTLSARSPPIPHI